MIPLLRDLILKDFWLKLFSFALAALIWFTVKIAIKNDISPVASLSLAPTEQEVLHDMPITVLLPSQEAHGFAIKPKFADVTVQGDAANLRNLRRQNVRVLVDLSDSGALRDSRRRVEVSTPPGITQVRVEPEEVQITTSSTNSTSSTN